MSRLYQVIEWMGRPRASRRARVSVYRARNQGDAIRQHWRKHEPGALLVTANRIYSALEGNKCCSAPAQGVGGVGDFEREPHAPPTQRATPATRQIQPVTKVASTDPFAAKAMLDAARTPATPAPTKKLATHRSLSI